MKPLCLATLIIALLLLNNTVTAKENIIPNEAIRLRIIANSNSFYDQYIKSKVKEKLQVEVYDLLKQTNTIAEARSIIQQDLKTLDEVVADVLTEQNYEYPHHLSFGYHYFPSKEYKGINYKEGYYESLLVTLGEGKGNNWWCVLFPPLCLLEAKETDEIEYKFFVQELINKYLKH